MTNGGTGPLHGKLVFANSGRGPLPPSLVLVDPADPSDTTVLLDNFFGRQFNSLNDVKIHPRTGKLFFTDVTCVPPVPSRREGSNGASQAWIPERLPPSAAAAEPGVSIRPRHRLCEGRRGRLRQMQRDRVLLGRKDRLRVCPAQNPLPKLRV